jgi:hypothetical protein
VYQPDYVLNGVAIHTIFTDFFNAFSDLKEKKKGTQSFIKTYERVFPTEASSLPLNCYKIYKRF